MKCFGFIIAAIVVATVAAHAGHNDNPLAMDGVEVVEHLGDTLPLDLTFVDDKGQTVALKDYFTGDKPVIVTLNYYNCPMLCDMVLNGMVNGLAQLDWAPGRDFTVVTVSIDAREKPALAAEKKQTYLQQLGKAGADDGWHFLTGERANIKALADAIGFGYRYDADRMEFAHGAAIFLSSPNGKLTRYLYGVQFEPKQLRLALVEAGEGKLGSTIDQVLLRCYHFDPASRKYGVYIWGVMRLGGGLTVFLVGGMLLFFWRRERRREVV